MDKEKVAKTNQICYSLFMPKMTPLMEQYEKENPRKHAIWEGLVTEQFKIWKAIKLDPSYNPRYLYEGKDGFKIVRKSWVAYYSKIMKTAIERYGLSENPDWNKLEQIGKVIFDYMNRPTFRIGYPVYCEAEHHFDITKIAGYLSSMNKQNLKSDKDYLDFCNKVMEQLKEADFDDYVRMMSH
jgi:hypothetical protein